MFIKEEALISRLLHHNCPFSLKVGSRACESIPTAFSNQADIPRSELEVWLSPIIIIMYSFVYFSKEQKHRQDKMSRAEREIERERERESRTA